MLYQVERIENKVAMPVGKNMLYAIESLKTNQINKLIVLMSIK